MEIEKELTSGVETELKRKLSLLAESSFEDGNDEAGFFINQFLNKETFDVDIAKYLYASDIYSWMNSTVLDACMKLLVSDAETNWFMMIQSVSDEIKDPGDVCKSIIQAFEHGLDAEKVREVLANIRSAVEFKNEIGELIGNEPIDQKVDYFKVETMEEQLPDEEIENERFPEDESLFRNKNTYNMINEDEHIILKEIKKLNNNISQQLKPLSELQQQLNKLDEIKILSEKVSVSVSASRQIHEKIYSMEKEALKQRFQKEQMEKELKKSELTIRLLTKEKANLQNYLKHNSSDKKISEEIKELKEKESTLQEQLEHSMKTNLSLKDDKKQLELVIEELKDKNNKLQLQLIDKTNELEQVSTHNQKLQERQIQSQVNEETVTKAPEMDPYFKQEVAFTSEQAVFEEPVMVDEMDFLREMGWNPNDIKDIVPDKVGLRERVMNFARKHSRYYEKEYQKRPISEQENLLFVKMMELHFSKEKVLLIKNTLQSKKSLSRVEIYKFLARNPSEEELTKFCENAA